MTTITEKLAEALKEAMTLNWVSDNALGNLANDEDRARCLDAIREYEAAKATVPAKECAIDPANWTAAFPEAAKGAEGSGSKMLIKVDPQPSYIESSGRWRWPLPEHARFPGCCTAVFTASREWWEYAPSEAKPHPMAEGVMLRDGIWYWCVPFPPAPEQP